MYIAHVPFPVWRSAGLLAGGPVLGDAVFEFLVDLVFIQHLKGTLCLRIDFFTSLKRAGAGLIFKEK
jgi:hypothetical protein